MTQNSGASEPEDAEESEFVEVDPSGRYGRYKQVLGKGAFKKVYRAFDEWEGLEVAWNQVKVADLVRNSVDLERLYSEVHLLKTLKHKNIIKFYNSWVDTKNEHINFITEIFTSGTLRQYRKKHKHVDVRALKKWSRQILEGLSYLHSHDPPVIHRDLKCDNIFVNGNQGEVKIGDLGLAAILQQARAAHSVIGTPEFMAPELYEEEYNELVDIYAFGMCLLELVTLEYPYVECANAAQIYKKVTSGIKPASLGKVQDLAVQAFIEKCIAKVSDRLSARELLMDPFLHPEDDSKSRGQSLEPRCSNADHNSKHFYNGSTPEDAQVEGGRDFTVQGQRKDQNTIFLKLRIADSSGNIRNIHFPFDIEEDTSTAVASEMVEELDLTDHDVTVIASMIDSEIRFHIPGWAPREFSSNNTFNGETVPENGANDDASPITNDSVASGPLVLERLSSGRKVWCNSPKAFGDSPLRPGSSNQKADSAASGDSWSEENPQSPGSHNDDIISTDAGTPRHAEYDSDNSDYSKGEEGSESSDPITRKIDRYDYMPDSEPLPLDENVMPCETDLPDLKTTIEKLEQILVDQMRELVELKQKHKVEVLDCLKDLPKETRQSILIVYNRKIHKLWSSTNHTTNKSLDQIRSTESRSPVES